MYAKDISKKITSVKRNKQKQGLFIGGKHIRVQIIARRENKIVIDPPAAAIVHRIFTLALHGMSCRQIAVTLNGEGIPTPADYAGITPGRKGLYSGKWSAERISFMLQNETYIGNMVQGRLRKVNYKIKKCRRVPKEDWTIVEHTHEPIVSAETFRKGW